MSTNAKRLLVAISIMVAAVIGLDEKSYALRFPHASPNITTCNQCHSRVGAGFKTISSFNNLCFNSIGCHNSSGGIAPKKAFNTRNASNRFGSLPANWSTIKQVSHGWKIPNTNPNAGVPAGNAGLVGLGGSENSRTKDKIYCTRCHRAMGTAASYVIYDKFLRADPTGNYVCFQCHSARRTDNVREPLQAGLDYSHPVEVNYSTARAAKPTFFETTPQLASVFGYKTSASVRLYTTHNSAAASIIGSSRLAGTNRGAVVCQSCHGPIHSADSNPYTFDNLSAYSRLGKYSTSAGNLLRMYPIAGPKASNNLCLSCHKVQSHITFTCGRCHTPHKKPGENNRYLILENISTPYNGIRSVVFTSRSAMAARFGGYSYAFPRLDKVNRPVSNRICQVCHTGRTTGKAIKHHRNYSSPNGSIDRTHNYLGNDKYNFCPNCHKHTSGFVPSGCSTCHNFPPSDTISATDSFKHGKHTDANVEPNPTNSFWKTGTVTDSRSDSSYGFSCGRCHSPWGPYTAVGVDGYQGKNHFFGNGGVSDLTMAQKNYTVEVGFKIKTSINPLPWNPSGYYVSESTDRAQDPGATGGTTKWWGAGTGATCRDLYCHGQWYNGYTSNNPNARGTQACGKCHGASNTDPPGKTNGVNYGAHPRHVGSANSQQYGSGTPNFRCNACHSLTAKYNNETTVSSRKYHVNGRVNIKFDNGSSSSFRVGNGSSNYGGYGGYNGYSSRRPAMFVRPAYNTCRLIYCHSRGNRTLGNYSAPNNAGINPSSPWPNWSSSKNFTTTMSIGGYTMKTRCARCHGNSTYKGITMAMPNYTGIAYGGAKENSHRKHVIENNFRCNICHSATINSANNTIASTRNHVNKFYNISIISTYRDNGVGNNYDNNNKTCSSIKCHAGKTTPKWGSKIGCADCHLNNAVDYNKRILNNEPFQNFSETAPKIYSTAWAESGHGRPSGDYYGKDDAGGDNGNPAANKTCTNCHKASVPHGTASNPFRLYTTHSGNPNALCEDCHGLASQVGNGGAPSSGSKTRGIQTHASSVVGSKKYNFAIKCIDCHDPHGDNNILMLHSSVARPRITSGSRRELSDQYGRLLTNITTRNIDFVDNQYTSNFARKYQAARICQNCHTKTADVSSPFGGRFRWYSAADKTHGGAKCTVCHTHASGFKGAGCDACHGWPPRNRATLIGHSSTNRTEPMTGSTTAGAHLKHYTTFYNMPGISSKTAVCGLCHQGGMYPNGAKSGKIEIGFGLIGVYTTGTYNGQSNVTAGVYNYAGKGRGSANNTKRCSNVKCHGGGNWLTASYGTPSSPQWDRQNSVKCGRCHGAKKAQGQGSWPTSNRHAKHAGTDTGGGQQYDFMCKFCHSATIMNTATTLSYNDAHVNGKATFLFYTGAFTGNRLWSGSTYSGDDVVNSGWGRCRNLYCHSRGTKTAPPYANTTAFPNYTARWDTDLSQKFGSDTNKRCSYCHGNMTYNGITAAMPNYTSSAYGGPKVNSHRKHVVENGLKCSYCHSATITSANDGIANTGNHVNKFINVTIVGSFKTGQTMYSSSLSSTNKTCKNVRCHAGKTTPRWGNKITCQNCHLSSSSDTDDFTFNSFSGTAAKIYSSDWTKRGHGKSRSSGDYAFSNNSGAAKGCTNCHKPSVKHGDTNNYFRLMTSNPDRLCLACHGIGTERIPSIGFSQVTGIQSHSWYNISTAGYTSPANGNNVKKASLYGGWNFGAHDGTDQKKVKCVDCHDPHGDRNDFMIHTYPNYSGSDRVGRPANNNVQYNITTNAVQMIFTAVGGPQMNWSSYTKPVGGAQGLGICQRCHSVMSNTTAMTNHNKGLYSGHNAGTRCTNCHKHRQGFKPSGCEGCHGYPPPKGPGSWKDSMTGYSSLHTPHAINPRFRPISGFGSKFGSDNAWGCEYCHDDSAAPANMGQNPNIANLNNLTSQTGYNGYNIRARFTSTVNGAVADDKCSNVWCHTPRTYQRQWRKPTGCDGCHGYQNKTNLSFNIQTTGSHKAHIHYTSANGYNKRKYGLRCTQCHVDNANNYSTHYSRKVDINFKTFSYNNSTAAVYSRGSAFKGATTGGEFGSCSKVYCHGRFVNGTTITQPKWGNKFTGCSNCHKSKGTTPGDGSAMPERHPKHVGTAGNSSYGFTCVRCHSRTVGQANLTTIMFSYSSHVNKRKDVYFDDNGTINQIGGSFASSARQCSNIYCHSKGFRSSGLAFNTRTTLANYTADWDVTAAGRTNGKPCSFCHGNSIYAGITAAMPNYTSGWGNSHRTHVIRNNFKCIICHSATVTPSGAIDYTGGKHVNGFKNITIIAAYKQGQTLYSSQVPSVNKTCKNVKCHAGKKTPKWGTYIRCQDCHLSSTGDTDKRISANNIFQSFTAKANPTAPRIYSTAWATQGHGRQSAYPSGNPAANKTCTNCHKASVAHGTASNPFRLYTINSVTGNPNTLCEDCHGTAPGNPSPGTKTGIQTHASSVIQTGRHNFAIKCVDCHDPHGDNNTRFMVHSAVARPRITGTRAEISNNYGSAFLNATVNVDFNQNLYTSDYAKKIKSPKICQVCHTRTFKPNSAGVTRFRWNGSNDNSHGVGKCTNCHSHGQGFKGAKCDSCHGYPPTLVGFNTLSGSNTNPKQRASGTNTAGGHGRHSSILLQGQAGGDRSALCNFCHSGGMAATGLNDGDITLKFSAFGYYTGVNQKYRGQTAVQGGYYGYSGTGAGTANGSYRCESVKCHGGGGWLTKSFGSPTAPKWNDTTRSTVFCGSCHGTKKAANQGTWPTTNAHTFHAGTSIRQQDLMCRTCHGITVLNSATTLSKSNHVNGAVYVKFTSEARVGGSSSYSGDTVVNSGFGQCTNLYCHSKGTDRVAPYSNATAFANFTATWTQTRGSYKQANGVKAKCNYCHGNKSWSGVTSAMPNYPDTSPKANKHFKHVRTYNFLCTNCHKNVVANNTSIQGGNYTLHVNRAYNLEFGIGSDNSRGIDNSQGRYTSTNSGCRGTYCHSRGVDLVAPFNTLTTLANYTAHWGDSRGSYKQAKANMAKCNYCHGSRNTYSGMTSAMPNYNSGSPKANRHPMHVANYGFSCTVCHDKVTSNSTSIDAAGGSDLHVNQIYNVDFNKDIPGRSFINNTGAYTYQSAALGSKCKNTYCHSRGTDFVKPFNTRTSFANWTARWGDTRGSYKQANGLKAKCNYCHGNRTFSGMTSAMPNYSGNVGARTAKANSHRKHVVDNGYVCSTCHYGVVPNNTSISDRSRHMNGFYNISITPDKKNAGKGYSSVYGPSGGFCKNNKCHGTSTPQWGNPATANCKVCHFSTGTSDTDNYAKPDGTKAEIYSSEWKRKGHGQFAPFTSTNANTVRCLRCHNSSVGHNTASNPFRLYTSQSIALCGNCHGSGTERNKTQWGGSAGYADSIYQGIATHTEKATGGDASWNTHSTVQGKGVKCIDCHDPHGDKNKKMIHAYINHSGSDNFGRPAGRPWGDTEYNINNRAQMTFTSLAGGGQITWSSFASGDVNRSICRRCHTPKGQDTGMGNRPDPNYGEQTKTNYADGHQPHDSKCTSCHTHPNGFKGGACDSCHGFPPTATFNLLSGAGRSNEIKQRSSGNIDRPGGHGKHTSIFGATKTVCSYCHSGGMADTSQSDGNITLKFAPFGYYTGINQKYRGAIAVKDGFYGYSGSPGMKTSPNDSYRCESVKCHGGGGWLTKSFGSPTAPKWNDTTRSTVFCGSCHGTKKAANQGTWPTTNAHTFHAGTSIRQQDLMCRTCHGITVLNSATTLSKSNHVNGAVYVKFTSEARVGGSSSYSGDTVVNSGFGQCTNLYCHSKGTDRVAPYSNATAFANFTATWTQTRGSYKQANGVKAKCNYCHGNKSWSGVTSAMPNYNDGTPKANKHPKHVKEYNFLCTNCHKNVVANNTSIQGGNYTLHVNRAYNLEFGIGSDNSRGIDNSQGRYTSTNSGCRGTYCHSRGTKITGNIFANTSTLANYTAHWGDTRGSYKQAKANMAKCNFCHGSRNTYSGMTSAMPNYNSGSIKANRHPMHVVNYGFTCTVCHEYVTSNNTSIDAAGGMGRHVNQSYNVDFKKDIGRFANNTGSYTYQASYGGGIGSNCKNTYCHSRGTDFTPPFNTRTSFANWTARWGDTRGDYKQANGLKAKCNYCHGNRLFSGITSAMPNYSSSTAKNNTHPLHVRSYGFTCTVCHAKVAANNTSISDRSLHVNQGYNLNFNKDVPGRPYLNNTGNYTYILSAKSRCKNTWCHSRGTDFTKPYNTRTSFANFTAMWGDTRGNGGYKQAKGFRAKCNYCHGNRAYSGMTSAMPNYSGNSFGTPIGVTAKANSHKKHVVDNGFVCSTCHNSIANSNTSISDKTRHVNGFYNISITPSRRKAGGQKVYSMVYNGTGGTCMNNTCHGDSKPQWGNPNTANCKACHFSGTKDTDDYARANNSNKAEIYSSEWKRKGHGQFDAFTSRNINRCERCHNSNVAHNFAQGATPSNPFRLFTSETITVCNNCHGTSAERNLNNGNWPFVTIADGAKTDIVTHSKAATGGDASWNTHSTVRGKAVKCVDCHDPHGDKNRRMIHSYLNHSGSDRFGRPAGPTWGAINYSTAAMMTFTAHGASGGQLIWSSFANNNVNRSICRRCHTPKSQDTGMGNQPSPNYGEQTKTTYAVDHQDHSATCTASCHTHKTGFKPGGESDGNKECSQCHGASDLFGDMRSPNGYHHVLMNTSAAAGSSKYPNQSSFGPSDQKSSKRRCLMCHVDHNIFRPDINTDGTGGRAKNLRWSVSVLENRTGINTDFWPAKRKNATGRLNGDSGSGNYSSTYPIYGPSQYNGICISCHKNIQYKNTTNALVNQFNVAKARPFSVALYTSSSHNFQVISSTFVFGSGANRSRFRGNCTKCHRTSEAYSDLSKPSAQQGNGRFPVALHDKNVPSLMMNIATSSFEPKIEQLCFNCHDNLAKSDGGPGSMDLYSSVRMQTGAKMIKAAITGKKYNKPIEDIGMAGNHKVDEYYKAVTSVNENSNPSVLWNYSSTGAAGGVGRHIECVDCHNTHGGNAAIRRIVGAPFRGKLTTGQPSYFSYTASTGNKIAGAQKGVWGVSISYSNGLSYRGQTPKFKKVAQVTYQYEVCLKCHSRYAYGTNPPGVPDGLPDSAGTMALPFDNLASDVPQADISRMINPNNFGYHPIFRKGRNQPPDNANSNWPAAKSNWMYKDRFNNKTAFISVSGLSWNFVPPFSQHSLLACTDCHVADNTNKAAQKFKPTGSPALNGTSWTGATLENIERIDGKLAVAGQTAATLQTDVTVDGSNPGPAPEELWVVAYGSTTASTANGKKQTLEAFDGIPGTSLGAAATTPPFSSVIGRAETKITFTPTNWTLFETNYSAKITTGSAGTVSLDYLGLEGVYTMTAEVRGPHGSMQRWILTDVDRDIWFDADNNNALNYSNTDRPNANTPADGVADGIIPASMTGNRIFCWNCHRRDVYHYNNPPATKYLYSRIGHATTGGMEDKAWSIVNQWGITCMNCHAGNGVGEIHGSFANSTTNWIGDAQRANIGRPRGVRLLNGAVFNGGATGAGILCYTVAGTATPFGGACGGGHTGNQSLATNYSYTSW